MRRRTFLGLGAGVFGSVVTGGIWSVQPRPVRVNPDEDLPRRLSSPRRVVVVGGGLAGLSAALDLAERGFVVTLLEQAGHLGGKLGGWNVRALGETFPVEHGFHGFFAQYYTLDEQLRKAGVDRGAFDESPGYPVRFASRPDERFGTSTSVFPANLISVVARSPNIGFADFTGAGEALYELMRYRGDDTFRRYDDVDFARFCTEGGVPASLRDTVLLPFAETTLNRPTKLSAAAAIRFFHTYFMGNPEGLSFSFTTRDSMHAVIDPLERRLVALGGEVRKHARVTRLVRDRDRVRAIVVGEPASSARETVSITRVPAAGYLPISVGGAPAFVARRASGFVAFDARCTHMGCPVRPDPSGSGFVCPCHGGRFGDEGEVVGGPPERPLRRLHVVEEAGALVLSAPPGRGDEEVIPCDHCVVACEVRGLKRLLAASAHLDEPALRASLEHLGESEPYVVLRVWLDRPVRESRAPFATTYGFPYTDSLALYCRFQEPFRTWASRTGGAVVELHAYAIPPERLASLDVIQARMLDEMRKLLPELAPARVLHAEMRLQDDFSRFAPGDHARRPATRTPVRNLHLAGDHVRLPVPASLMEAAVLSGRFAANAILEDEGLRKNGYQTVPLAGPLA